MNKINEKRNVLFFSYGESAVDQDWTMPLALNFKKNRFNVSFLLIGSYSFDKSIENKYRSISFSKNFDVYYRDHLYPIGFLIKSFIFIRRIVPFNIDKYIRKSFSLFTRILNLVIFAKISNELSKIVSNNEFIFASNNPEWSRTCKLSTFFYKNAKASSSIFIGHPIMAWPHWYHKKIFPFDLFLTSSNQEYHEIVNAGIHPNVKFLGCPCLDVEYLSNFNSAIIDKSGNKNQLKTVLFIMINTNNWIYSNFPILQKIKKIISELLSNGFEVIFKSHPSDVNNEFDVFSKNNPDNFKISSEPIEVLSFKVDIIITLLSAGILKAIALGIPSFLFIPKSFLKTIQKQNQNRNIYIPNNSVDETWIEKFCVRFSNIDEFLLSIADKSSMNKGQETFVKYFEPKKSTDRILNYLEGYLKLNSSVRLKKK